MSSGPDLSVIIPYRNGEEGHKKLGTFFKNLGDTGIEVLTVNAGSRAKSLNEGAKKAKNTYLWFVHADTVLDTTHIHALRSSIRSSSKSLHFFDLEFDTDGPALIKINAFMANIRARFLGIPWGDQAFCIHRDVFFDAKGFPEDRAYGEDHVFVWRLYQKGYGIKPVGIKIVTSARAYRNKGWLRLTLLRQVLWIKQALPELARLWIIRIRKFL